MNLRKKITRMICTVRMNSRFTEELHWSGKRTRSGDVIEGSGERNGTSRTCSEICKSVDRLLRNIATIEKLIASYAS